MCTLDPLRRDPASSLPKAETCPNEDNLITSHIGISRGFEKSLVGGWRESTASSRLGP